LFHIFCFYSAEIVEFPGKDCQESNVALLMIDLQQLSHNDSAKTSNSKTKNRVEFVMIAEILSNISIISFACNALNMASVIASGVFVIF